MQGLDRVDVRDSSRRGLCSLPISHFPSTCSPSPDDGRTGDLSWVGPRHGEGEESEEERGWNGVLSGFRSTDGRKKEHLWLVRKHVTRDKYALGVGTRGSGRWDHEGGMGWGSSRLCVH